jgi:hypothetical protein
MQIENVTKIRAALIIFMSITWMFADTLQGVIDLSWEILKNNMFYRSCYFETLHVTAYYLILILIYSRLYTQKFLQPYKIFSESQFPPYPASVVVFHSLIYIIPLALLDSIIVKRYPGRILNYHERIIDFIIRGYNHSRRHECLDCYDTKITGIGTIHRSNNFSVAFFHHYLRCFVLCISCNSSSRNRSHQRDN